jgi:DNA-directed RNA polymerase specialized sigma24 family protein
VGAKEEDRQAILQILARQDPLTQELALYHYVDGMNMEEVAQVVGYSRKTVGKKLAEFRDEARRMLGDAR